MITVFSFSSPAVLPLYWTIGALFLIIQQYIARNFIKIEILVQQKTDRIFNRIQSNIKTKNVDLTTFLVLILFG